MSNMADLQRELDDLLARVEDLKVKIKNVAVWEPKGGEWCIDCYGDVVEYASADGTRLHGVERETEEQALKALEAMRIFNRLLAYRDEFAPDYTPDFVTLGALNWCIFFNHRTGKYARAVVEYPQVLGTVLFPEEVAEELVEKLNSGEVTL